MVHVRKLEMAAASISKQTQTHDVTPPANCKSDASLFRSGPNGRMGDTGGDGVAI